LLPECILSTLKTKLKFEQKCKNTKICQYLTKGWKISLNPKNFSLRRYFRVFYKELLLVSNYIEKKKCSKLNAIFQVFSKNEFRKEGLRQGF